jgi:hypothetical protein
VNLAILSDYKNSFASPSSGMMLNSTGKNYYLSLNFCKSFWEDSEKMQQVLESRGGGESLAFQSLLGKANTLDAAVKKGFTTSKIPFSVMQALINASRIEGS